MKPCRNCRTSFEGTYCPNCGQKDIDLERSLGILVGELLKETLEVDGRSFRTIRALFLRPGVLTAEFLAGRRKAYTPPLRLYLVISVSFFVLAAWLAGRGVLLDSGQSMDKDAVNQARFLSDGLPRLMFVLLPMFAALLKAVIPRRLFFDHVIFSTHLHSFAYVVLALMLPLENVGHWAAIGAQALLLAYLLCYFVISMHRVYGMSWIIATAKSAAVLLVYLVIFSSLIETASSLTILSD